MPEAKRWHIDLGGMRMDGPPWRISVQEFGGGPGPATLIVAGMIGDKPLGVLALHDLATHLADETIKGTVLVVPMLNPFGFSGGTRHNPDLVELNRRFPGSPRGLLSDQLAHTVITQLLPRVDAVIDVHSGTNVRTTEYIYDYDNEEFSASFAYLPIMVGRHTPGQLCTTARAAGKLAALIEFGGPGRNSTERAVEGCLNMLRHRGQIGGAPTGPERVAVLDQIKLFNASTAGALCSNYGPEHVGGRAAPGVLGWVASLSTGERLEEFTIEAIGTTAGMGPGFDRWGPSPMRPFTVTEPPVLMLAQTVPSLVQPGALTYIVGWGAREISTRRSAA
jgi:hypothetical protein